MIGKILGHYEILEKIGSGGMGEVYRAHDRQLDRDVAIKVLPAGLLADEASRKRFRFEALALAKLNHPNIETIHEFATDNGVDYLAMELITGEPLSAKLKDGPLAQREVTRLGTQLADGLAAAHGKGVIHRDLKPGNLFVTPEGRLKILDFGLAKLMHPDADIDLTRSASDESGVISGTVPYMSPEQLRGLPADARSDIYAAGAVLYEMATAARPFPQQQSAELIGAILHETPSAPHLVNQHIAPSLERLILKALEKDVSQRYQSARELLAALEGISADSERIFLGERETRPRRAGVYVAAAAVVLVVAAGLVIGLNVRGIRERIFHRKAPAASVGVVGTSAPVALRRSVAVLGFKNLSGSQDEAWLSTALAEMLTTELAAGGKLRTIPGENVAKMRVNLALPDADSFGNETLARIRSNVGADDVVLGSYLALGSGPTAKVRVDLRIQDAASSETLASVTESGNETDISDLMARAGAELRRKLGAGEATAAELAGASASLPSDPQAARYYAEGLAKLREFDDLGARVLLEKAVAAEPNFPLAHEELAKAWSGLGYPAKAREEAKKALDLSGNLPREEQLWVEASYRTTTREWDKAIENYRSLLDFYPDNLSYGMRLAAVQTASGHAQDALATLDRLRKLPSPSGDDPTIDLQEADCAEWLGDPPRQIAAAQRAEAKAKVSGARLIYAEGRWLEGVGLQMNGQQQKALEAYIEARKIYDAAGDKGSSARAGLDQGNLLLFAGKIPEAVKVLEQTLATSKEIGNDQLVAGAYQNLAQAQQLKGNLREARKMYESSLQSYRNTEDKGSIPSALFLLGSVMVAQGDHEGAKKQYEEAISRSREMNDNGFLTQNLLGIAGAFYFEGELTKASAAYEESLATAKSAGLKSIVAWCTLGLGDILLMKDDISGATEKKNDAQKLLQEANDQQGLAQVESDLAVIAIEKGAAADAEPHARKAIAGFHSIAAVDSEADTSFVLVEALFEQKKIAEAEKELRRGQALLKTSENPAVRIDADIAVARFGPARDDAAKSARQFGAIATRARQLGDTAAEFEARLWEGENNLRAGRGAAGKAELAELEKEATAKDYLLMARKARAAAVGR